ncbi:Sodium-dependent phosphate transporter [Crocosphaera watsonii WH 0402]|uniref:Sodium-dependent phosphate transporter n=1 Tax=Crocosphaera watsonii WH 0402 TaxID=1284629 RepID=T2JR09_CROWT|nr:Sodium-dependent phosphate transporter [Crocosphaera watsonii WH 0402]
MGERAEELFTFATNPFAGLIVGIMATALIQSSSTVTSIIVGLVAGGLPVSIAVPMVMGSNLGTTITNTIVSLGHIGNKEEFRKAFAAATIHDFFNLLAVLIFLPLEITTHFLEKTALFLAQFLKGTETPDLTGFNFVEFITVPVLKLMKQVTVNLPQPFDGIALITIGIVLIFVSILYIGKILKKFANQSSKRNLEHCYGQKCSFQHSFRNNGNYVSAIFFYYYQFNGSLSRSWFIEFRKNLSLYLRCEYWYLYYSIISSNCC